MRLAVIFGVIFFVSYLWIVAFLWFCQDVAVFPGITKFWGQNFEEGEIQHFIDRSGGELVPLTTASSRCYGLYFHHPGATAKKSDKKSDRKRPVVIYFHGNAASTIGSYVLADAVQSWNDEWDFFSVEYPGYAGCSGWPSDEALTSVALAAWEHVTVTRGIAPENIVLYGSSIGGGVVANLLAALAAAHTPVVVGGIWFESTFTNLTDVAAEQAPFLPVRYLFAHDMRPVDALRHLSGSTHVYISHSDADAIVPAWHAYALSELASVLQPDGSVLAVLQGDAHCGLLSYMDEAELVRWRRWMQRVARKEKTGKDDALQR